MSRVSYSKLKVEADIKKFSEEMRKELEAANNCGINAEKMDAEDFENKINEVVENTLNNDCVHRPENSDNPKSSKSTTMNKDPGNTPIGDNPKSSKITSMNKDPGNTPNGVPPKFTVLLENKEAKIGSDVTWYCKASGTPPITYCWMKGGVKINMENLSEEDKNRYTISRNSFVVRNVEAKDEGLYTCCAFNPVGNTSTSGDLKVIDKKINIGKAAAIGLGVAVGAFAAPAAVVGILSLAGFGAGGVVAGSVAAGVQSAVYGGATGGVFAVCQSIGAAGLGAAGTAASAAAGAAGGGAAGGLFSGLFSKGKESPNKKPPIEPTKE